MREAAASGTAPVETAATGTDRRNEIADPVARALEGLAGAADEAGWAEALLDGLEAAGLRQPHLVVERRGLRPLVAARGIPTELVAALGAGGQGAGAGSIALPGIRMGWAGGEASPQLGLLAAAATGALGRIRSAGEVARGETERLLQEVAHHAREADRARARELRYEQALAGAPLVLATQDRALRYTWVQGRLAVPAQVLGRTDFDLFPLDEAMALHAIKWRVLQSGRSDRAEVGATIRGRRRTYQLSVEPVHDAGGAVAGISFAAVDVTARVQEAGAREQLLLQREDERSWLVSVIERSPVGILLFEPAPDGSGERVSANRRAAELLGHPVDPARAREAVAGRLLRPDGSPMPFAELPSSRALAGQRVTMEEALLRRPDGTLVPIVISAGPIADVAGAQAGAVVTFDDATPFKELQRLREAWTSMITHDLRQPITSISGFAGVLAEHPDLPAQLRPKVVHIVAAARRLGRMTADLLEASRLESNQLALERQRTDLAELVGAVIERLAGELEDRTVEVEQRRQLPAIDLDPERFEQVLGNLLSNAARYGTPGSPIRVELDRQGSEVVVGVTNAGAGLAAEELGRIFDRFHRATSARRSRPRGLGLGLYIARGLVEAHGGRIWAETSPGTVTFLVALPLGA